MVKLELYASDQTKFLQFAGNPPLSSLPHDHMCVRVLPGQAILSALRRKIGVAAFENELLLLPTSITFCEKENIEGSTSVSTLVNSLRQPAPYHSLIWYLVKPAKILRDFMFVENTLLNTFGLNGSIFSK